MWIDEKKLYNAKYILHLQRVFLFFSLFSPFAFHLAAARTHRAPTTFVLWHSFL